MTLKEAVDLLRQYVDFVEARSQKSSPPSMDEIAARLWKGEIRHEFASEDDFKKYTHDLYESDLFAREKMATSR